MRFMTAPFVAVLLLPVGGACGETSTVSGSPRVRVWSPSHALVGRPAALLAAGGDSITIAVEGQPAPVLLPRSAVTKIQLSRGDKRNAGRGAVYGLVAGALLGLVAYGPSNAGECCSAPVFAGINGAIGSSVGGLVGAFSKTERWNDVPIDQLRVGSPARLSHRPGISIAVTF